MPIEIKQLAGVMNRDDSDEVIGLNHHKYAKNMRFYGMPGNLRGEGVKGNRLISNSFLPGDGRNETIGGLYDHIKQRIIWFNYNSEGKHGIYQYSLTSKNVTQLLVCFTHSATDILGFDLNYPIASANIIYASDDIGDTLTWCARSNRPMKLNLKDAEGELYGANWLEEYLTVARPMPLIAPTCQYKDDATVDINNLRKKLYEFRYRWVYKDFTKSTWSPYSKLFAPANPDDIADNIDEQKNNRIDVAIDTGNADVVKVEIAARQTLGTTFSDCFLVATLDKEDLSLVDNQLYTYQFFNDASYPPLDVEEIDLLFDYVPKIANCQELLNGNVIIYGGITEGYDRELLEIESSVDLVDYTTGAALLITLLYEDKFQYDDGGTTYWSYYAPFDIGGVPVTGDVYTMRFNSAAFGGLFQISYTVLAGDTTLDVATALSNAFNALTQTPANQYEAIFSTSGIFPSGVGIIIQNYPTVNTELELSFLGVDYQYANSGSAIDGVSNCIYKHKSRYGFGIVYFDDYGVTNGVITNADMLIVTPEIDTTGDSTPKIPQISFTINSQPPIWATKFSFVRTNNLSVQTLLTTVSANTKKDSGGSPDYAYIEITNQQANQNNFPIYSFSDGDRVRIIGRYGDAPTVYDFPIVSFKTDPKINGATATGDFLVIPYNAVLSNFGSAGYEHYDIEIYTPALNSTSSQQVYYEFGETYYVLNPGTGTRAHQGQLQDQIVGTQPATYSFIRGDFYLKQRKIPFNADLSSVTSVWIVDQSVSDLFPSKIVGNGRPFVVDEYAQENYFPTMVRWSLAYQQDTSINQTNRFYPINFDEIDRQKGDIQRFKTRDRILRVFQNRGCGQYGVYSRFIQNNDGTSQLVTTDEIITTNNINYYQGEYGLGDQYTGLVSGSIQDYFCDPVRGYQVRLSADGLTPISELYKGQFYIRNLITPYNLPYAEANGSRARIIGCYDYFNEEYVTFLKGYNTLRITSSTVGYVANISAPYYSVFYLAGEPLADFRVTISISRSTTTEDFTYTVQDGDTMDDITDALVALINTSSVFDATKLNSTSFKVTNPVIVISIVVNSIAWEWVGDGVVPNSESFSFNEPRNAYSSFFDIYPEWMVSAEDVMYGWKNGQLYVFDSETYANFFGTQYYPEIHLVFNKDIAVRKTYKSVSYQSNQIWESRSNSDVATNEYNQYTNLQQISQLKSVDYLQRGNYYDAAFLRDANSGIVAATALLDGDFLSGQWILLKLKYNGSNFAYIYEPYIKWQDNSRNF